MDDEIADRAFWTGIWRWILAGLIFLIVMLCYTASPGNALLVGADIALVYAFVMMLDAPQWRAEEERFYILRFAQSGAVVAMAFCLFARLV